MKCESIKASYIIISGLVHSIIYADTIIVTSSGVLHGNFFCKKLSIESGGIIEGSCLDKVLIK
jgi:cytoskeletal protein CcmA (bactofilin family)